MKKRFILEGLCCPNCGAKIEGLINEKTASGKASVVFATKTLVLEGETEQDIQKLYRLSKDIVKAVEPEVSVIEEGCSSGKGHDNCGYCHNDHEHHHEHGENRGKKDIAAVICGAVLALSAVFAEHMGAPMLAYVALYVAAYIAVGCAVLVKSAKNIAHGEIFDENFLMAVASAGAMCIGEFLEGIMVMLLYRIGEALQDKAVAYSRNSISALLDIRPDYANIKTESGIKKTSPDLVSIGDIIVVKPGERIPLDGIVVSGRGSVDTSALTGESVPMYAEQGTEVLSGSINMSGALEIKTTCTYENSTVAGILEMTQHAAERKARTESFITRFAKVYTPIVTVAAVLVTVVPPIFLGDFSDWLYKGLMFLVMSCPCALVISVPLTFFGGIGGASKKGVLVKGGNVFDALAKADTVIFDKTGTLTGGSFQVQEIVPYKKDEKALLEICAYAEYMSNHPIAVSVTKAYGKEISPERITGFEEIAGKGVKAIIDGKTVLAGNSKLVEAGENPENAAVVHIMEEGEYLGYILLCDKVKESAQGIGERLKRLKVRNTVILSGDRVEVCRKVAEETKADSFFGELLPGEKAEYIEKLKADSRGVIFVGDGINDAPALALADAGIAMGKFGSSAASEAADVVLMTDKPSGVEEAIKTARKTLRVAKQNIVFALAIKVAVMVAGLFGIANMWAAVFADVGVCFLAILNSMRMLKK